MANRNEGRVDMTTGAITPKLFHLAWPLVVGNLLQTAYNLADMFWVGRLNAEAVAAVSLMFPTAWLFISVSMGVTAASVALVSQHVGAGDERDAENVVAQSILLALGVAFALATVGYLIREPLVWVVGARGVVYDLSLAYLEVIFVSIPFTFLFMVFRAVLRAAGDTKTAMWLVGVSALLNIAIDPFFILESDPLLGFDGLFLGLGVEGAAVATLVSRAFAAAVGVYILLHGGWGIRLRLRDLRPDVPVLGKLVGVGYPATFDGLLRSVGVVVLTALVARFGPIVTAAYGIGLRLMSVSWTVSGAVGQAAATGVGQNLGADTPDRAEEVAWKATGGGMAVLFGFGGLAFLFPGTAMRIFIADVGVIEEGIRFLRIVALSWAFFGGLQVLQGAFRGAGHTKEAMGLSFLSRWAFRLPAMWLLAYPLGWGAVGLWWGFSVTNLLAFVVGVLWFERGGWKEGIVDRRGAPGPPGAPDDAESGPDADATTDD